MVDKSAIGATDAPFTMPDAAMLTVMSTCEPPMRPLKYASTCVSLVVLLAMSTAVLNNVPVAGDRKSVV